MANNSIEKMLEISNKLEKGSVSKSQNTNSPKMVATQQDLDRLIENYDKQVYGPTAESVLKQGEHKPYSAEEEFERIRKMEENGGRGAVNLEGRNIPRNIVESIINNPLDMPAVIDTKMDEFEQKLAGKGIRAAVDIMKKTDKQDQEAKEKLVEQKPHTQNTSVDYELIKTLIENAIDKKLGNLKQTLDESVSHAHDYIPSMKYMSFKDKFYFVDNDDNVFECVMRYKGKRKKKQ